MPPSGFIRSGLVDTKVDGGLVLIGGAPSAVNPFVFDACLECAAITDAGKEHGTGSGRSMPGRLVELCEQKGGGDGGHLCLLVNNLLFHVLQVGVEDGRVRVSTTSIDQHGGDFYLLAVNRNTGPAQQVAVQGVWRVWGDTTGGAFGQKARFVSGENAASSTAEGYEVAGRPPDLVLSDEELEAVHLLSFPIAKGGA